MSKRSLGSSGVDPARPGMPSAAGWQPDPWGDGERYWDGEIWTRQIRALGSAAVVAPAAAASPQAAALDEDDSGEDPRPLRSVLVRGMIWAFAVLGIIALLLTAVSMWPLLLRDAPDRVVVPQQSARSDCAPVRAASCYT